MTNELGPMTGGLLARLNPTGGPNNAILATDGGGSRQATDGGGRSRSGIVVDALTRTQAAIVRDSDDHPDSEPGAAPARKRAAPIRLKSPGQAVAARKHLVKAHGFDRYESWVRLELVRTSLLGELRFAGSSVHYGRANLFRLGKPNTALLDQQAQAVAGRAAKREDRLSEIFVQIDDLWPFWQAITRIETTTSPRTAELLTLALQFATSVVMQLKDWAGCRRPSEVRSSIVPIIDVPGHPSLPSGHATSAFILSGVLQRLIGLGDPSEHPTAKLMQRLAFRVAHNREVAGVHFPIDSAAGHVLGDSLAGYFCAAAVGGSDRFHGAKFLCDGIDAGQGLDLARATDDTDIDTINPRAIAFAKDQFTRERHDWLGPMWDRARAELDMQGLLY